MATYYVTFPIGGLLADSYTTIDALDEHSARLAVVGCYGTAGFASVYPEHRRADAIDKYGLVPVPFGTGQGLSAPADAR